MPHDQITLCAFMGKICQYICHIWSCSLQWCSQYHCTQMAWNDNDDANNNDNNDATVSLHRLSWPLGQISQKKHTREQNFANDFLHYGKVINNHITYSIVIHCNFTIIRYDNFLLIQQTSMTCFRKFWLFSRSIIHSGERYNSSEA